MTDLPTDARDDVEPAPIDLTAELVAVPTADAGAEPVAGLPVLAPSQVIDTVTVADPHPVVIDDPAFYATGSGFSWKSMAGPLVGVALVSLGLGFLMARGAADGGVNNISARTITTPARATTSVTTAARAGSQVLGGAAVAAAPGTGVGGTSTASVATSTPAASGATSVAGTNATGSSTGASGGNAATSASTTATTVATTAATTASTTATTTATTAATTTATTAAAPVVTTPAPTTAPPTTPAPTTAPPTTLSPGATYRAAVLAAGPQGYWSLDEVGNGTAADASGKGRAGSFSGGVTGGQPGAGAGTAVSFNGTDGAMTVPDANALRLNGSFSIEMWVKLDSFTHTWPGLLAKGSASGANGYLIYFKPDGRMVFKRNNTEVATNAGALTNSLNHFVVTFDGGTMRWYVNGALQTTKAITFPANNGSDPFVLGRGDEYGTITVDELAVYGSALDGGAVASHYDALR